MFERKGQKLGSVLHESTEPSEVEDVDPFDSTTVAELKTALGERGLSVSGNKADLFARLQDAEQVDDESEEESDGDDDEA